MEKRKNILPVLWFGDTNNCLQLRFANGSGLAILALLESFADTEDDAETSIDGGTRLRSD